MARVRASRRAAATARAARDGDRPPPRCAGRAGPSRASTTGCRGRGRRRGNRTCSPTASVTGRPLRWISCASCTPVADPPTTSTPPSASCRGIAIGLRRQLLHARRHALGNPRHDRLVERAVGQHHGAAQPVAAVGDHPVADVVRLDPGHRGLREHRGRQRRSVARHEIGDLAGAHVAVGIVALVVPARKAAQPVGREQAQAIPALGAPGVGDLATLEHHVLERALPELAAHRQAVVAGTDDDHVDGAPAAHHATASAASRAFPTDAHRIITPCAW